MGNLSIGELLVIFCVVLLFFGARRIPEIARALGKASREFKNARDGIVTEVKSSLEDDAKPEGGKNGKAGSDRPE